MKRLLYIEDARCLKVKITVLQAVDFIQPAVDATCAELLHIL
jgi:hypothetical protein